MRRFKLFALQVKTSFICVSKGLLTVMVALGIVMLILMGLVIDTDRVFNDGLEASVQPVLHVAIVDETPGMGTDYLLSMIQDYEGLSTLCSFDLLSWEDASARLSSREMDMIIQIPDDFFAKASTMQDTSLQIITYGPPTKVQKKLLGQIGAVQELMSITEAAILAMYDGIEVYELPINRQTMEMDIFGSIMSDFLQRDSSFSVSSLSMFGKLSVLQYYYVSLVIIMAFMSGVTCMSMYHNDMEQLEKVFYQGNVILASIIRVVAITIPIYILVMLMMIPAGNQIHVGGYLIIAVSVALWVHLIAVVSGDSPHSRMIYVVLVLLMMIASGLVIPDVYLPAILRKVSIYIPTGAYQTILLNSISGNKEMPVFIIVVTDVTIAIISEIIYSRRLRRHD